MFKAYGNFEVELAIYFFILYNAPSESVRKIVTSFTQSDQFHFVSTSEGHFSDLVGRQEDFFNHRKYLSI